MDLPDRLAAAGLPVVAEAGWTARGRPRRLRARGVVDHHTAGSRKGGPHASLGVVIRGRDDLPGPLCQLYVCRVPEVHVIARGYANHAGSGGWRGLRGNGAVAGIEVEHDGRSEPWPADRLAMADVAHAVLLRALGRGAEWLCGHKEWAPNRKPDPVGVDMGARRGRVAAQLAQAGGPRYDPSRLPARVLGLGDRGPDVRLWQRQLTRMGFVVDGRPYDDGDIDGSYGPRTDAATRMAQRHVGVEVDGLVGPKTREAVAAALDADGLLPLGLPVPLLYARRRTPDARIAAVLADETGHTLTVDPETARRAAAGGGEVVAIGGPAVADLHGANCRPVTGATFLDTAAAAVKAARNDWPA